MTNNLQSSSYIKDIRILAAKTTGREINSYGEEDASLEFLWPTGHGK